MAAAATASLIISRAMSSSNSAAITATCAFQARRYVPRHSSWPYDASDFNRQDASSDASFYRPPRLVTHIDDAAIESLRSYYDTVLPSSGRILDLCSSWLSHYPPRIQDAASEGRLRIVGLGMNEAELDANPVLNAGRLVKDLNSDPELPRDVTVSARRSGSGTEGDEQLLDAATCVVSIDYLTKPVAVLASLLRRTKDGGSVHLIVSNRCFPTKAISRWLRVDEDERLLMVGDFLHFAGWSDIEILDLKAPLRRQGQGSRDDRQGPGTIRHGLDGLMRVMGVSNSDPLWCVRARKCASPPVGLDGKV